MSVGVLVLEVFCWFGGFRRIKSGGAGAGGAGDEAELGRS